MNKNFANIKSSYEIWPELNASKNNRSSKQQYSLESRKNHSHAPNQTRYSSAKKEKGPFDYHLTSQTRVNIKDTKILNDGSRNDKQQSQFSASYHPEEDHVRSENAIASTRENIKPNDLCSYWNNIEDVQYFYQNNTNHRTPPPSGFKENWNFQSCASDSSLPQNSDANETQEVLSREEIVARRRLKVKAKRQMKKLEKQQLKEFVSGIQAAKPDFSLESAKEDFPVLNATKKIKKTVRRNGYSDKVEPDGILPIEHVEPSKTVEKSWKPKVKDPININLSEALQTKHEKSKPVTKKVDVISQRNILVGNTLDSDNPQRKKGKVYPDKVQKPSKLKGQILLGRKERYKNLSDDTQACSEKPDDQFSNRDQNYYIVNQDLQDEINELLAKCAFLETEIEHNPVNEVEVAQPQTNLIVSEKTQRIHSRKFREYCSNCLTEDVITSVCSLLEKVALFQDRTYIQNPIKANAKRRYVAGINQTNKFLRVKKVKLLVIAPDLEKNSVEGGLDDRIYHFKEQAETQGVPCVFGPNRKRLGKTVHKNALVSCVAVLSYEGAEEQFSKVMDALDEAKSKYLLLTGASLQDTKVEVEPNDNLPVTYDPATDVTSSLLAELRASFPRKTAEPLDTASPADELLSAIQRSACG